MLSLLGWSVWTDILPRTMSENNKEQHSYAADEKDYEEVQAWTKTIRLYADEIKNS